MSEFVVKGLIFHLNVAELWRIQACQKPGYRNSQKHYSVVDKWKRDNRSDTEN